MPLFNNVVIGDSEISITAGSAPDALGIGEAIGLNSNNTLVEFNATILNNNEPIIIDVETNKDRQDALADRYANRLDSKIVNGIHSQRI